MSGNRPQSELSSLGVLLNVALEVNLCTFRKEAFAAFLTAAAQCVAPCLGAHAGTKTVLAFANSFGWLISTFHDEMRSKWAEPLFFVNSDDSCLL
tara:strand:+ start:941 stop:1225 length:285 start_codon:yes stop_codon:yes gene_type:complete